MSGVRLTWRGPQVERQLRARLVRDLERLGSRIQAKAKARAPVRSGKLRSSVEVIVQANLMRVTIGSDVSYASYQNFGTSRGVPATHFLDGSLREETATFQFSTG
jgi:HK97 gp10 family phage protein